MNLRKRKSQFYYQEDLSDFETDVSNDETASQEDIPNEKTAESSSINLKRSEFLKLIKEHPVLYDVNHPDFLRNDLMDIAWTQISTQTGINGLFFVCFEYFKLC